MLNFISFRRNFSQILEIAEKFKIDGLLRFVETFVLESGTIHKIRKLEYAAEYRMSRLADFVLRSFETRMKRLECLHEYLAQMNESLDDVHPNILEMLEISSSEVLF